MAEKAGNSKNEVKAQSAMEFILSYGWMFVVLIIMVGILYELGAFSPITQPRAQPGACQVSRPYGPYTIDYVSLEGVCDNLLPQYVSAISQTNNGHILIPLSSINTNSITVTFWMLPDDNGDSPQDLLFLTPLDYGVCWENNPGNAGVPWQFVAMTINSEADPNWLLYQNTTIISAEEIPNLNSFNSVDIGGRLPSVSCGGGPTGTLYNLQGYVSNLQFYSTALNANQLQVIYIEGLGGDPTDLANLTAWWPLNGNLNDYSGNGASTRASISITFSGSITENYTAP